MKGLATTLALAVGATLTAHGIPSIPEGSALVTREVYLMGTRATLATYASARDKGLSTLAAALAVLEQTEGELSTWRDSSDISALNRHPVGTPWQANPRVCRMFADIWQWHHATGGAFDPAIGRLLAAWDIHGEGSLPSAQKERRAQALSGLARLTFDSARCTVMKRGDVSIDVGAFGKGEALDRVEATLGREPWMIDLGGQVSVGGAPASGGWPVAIADPTHRDRPVLQVRLTEGSLSTSGRSERDLIVDGRRVSHIFDPRTGQPAPFAGAVTVWHRRGLAADVLSTALFVMGPEEGLRWAEAHGIAAMYLIPEGGSVRREATRALGTASGVRVIEPE